MRRIKKWMIIAIAVYCIYSRTNTMLYNINVGNVAPVPSVEAENVNEQTYEVIRVVDGDTFVIEYENEERKVRLIGVDTPESVHADDSKNTEEGMIASVFTKELLNNKSVVLEFDKEMEDRYNRLLAYVYVDNKMVQETLLEEGYAKVMTIEPNVKYAEHFKNLETLAKEANVGLWER